MIHVETLLRTTFYFVRGGVWLVPQEGLQTNDKASAESQVFKTMNSGEKKNYHQTIYTFVNNNKTGMCRFPELCAWWPWVSPKLSRGPWGQSGVITPRLVTFIVTTRRSSLGHPQTKIKQDNVTKCYQYQCVLKITRRSTYRLWLYGSDFDALNADCSLIAFWLLYDCFLTALWLLTDHSACIFE